MVGARDFVFLAKMRDQLRQALAVRGRQKSAVLIALAIVLGEMREVLFEEGKEYGRGARLQKKRVGQNVFGASFGSGADDGFEILGRIGDPGNRKSTRLN